MKKPAKVVMLPTEKVSKIVFELSDGIHNGKLHYASEERQREKRWNYQHLYLISDNEIKEGDYHYNSNDNCIYQAKKSLGIKAPKVIATTDKYFSCSNNSISNIFSQIPESFIKAYIKAHNEGKPITEVQVEQGEKFSGGNCYKTREDNTIIIHQVKTYTREEVKSILTKYDKDFHNNIISIDYKDENFDVDKWIEENL